jgi:hypothetical protein
LNMAASRSSPGSFLLNQTILASGHFLVNWLWIKFRCELILGLAMNTVGLFLTPRHWGSWH